MGGGACHRRFTYLWGGFRMTAEQKNQIQVLRDQGYSYAQVADKTDLSLSSVKSFCRRNIGVPAAMCIDCKQCGKPVAQREKTKPKQFCSDTCRMAWWNARPEAVSRKAYYDLTCAGCGQPFRSYGNRNRQYCGRACFGLSRRKAVIT